MEAVMNTNEFRKELVKIMPGYKWTIHRDAEPFFMDATGIKSSGFNRVSTLSVWRVEDPDGTVEYTARSSGYGKRAEWLGEAKGRTLSQALRDLQSFYERIAMEHSGHARALQSARQKPNQALETDG
jgi:hypothetical protein